MNAPIPPQAAAAPYVTNSPITESEARAMVCLIAEVAGRHSDHATAKRRLMEGLCHMIGADRWVWGLTYLQPTARSTHTCVQYGGFDKEQFAQLAQTADHPDMVALIAPFAAELERSRGQITRLRQEIDPADKFSDTEVHELFLRAGVRPLLLSARSLNERCQSFVAIYREKHREDFTFRERRIAHILLSEVSWLHGLGWPEDMGVRVPGLPPRSRTVLNLLLDGRSRKEIADELGISIHTVSGYVKEIYSAFRVRSHAELMRRLTTAT